MCRQHTVVLVIFGMAHPSLGQAEARGEVVLGGCDLPQDYTGREVACTSCDWKGNHSKNGSKVAAARRRPHFE